MPLTLELEDMTLEINDELVVVVAPISKEPDNRLEQKPDGLYVRDRLDPDPVTYYLLAKG